jgi:glycosyltransferase involved in cell wall biosynthesis
LVEPRRISVIVTTYNWPGALDRVLDSLSAQTWPAYEVIVADDGSGRETKALVDRWARGYPVPLRHAWQTDEGFRAARVRNLGAACATGDYLVFIDGDCLCLPGFVESHAKAAEKGWFATGRRVQVRQSVTPRLIEERLSPYRLPRWRLFLESPFWLRTRIFQLLPLPFMEKRRRTAHVNDVKKAESCNLGLWARDFAAVAGFDERFHGFGCEDVDLCLRLLRYGLKRKSLEHLDPVLHLYHGRKPVADAARAALDATKADAGRFVAAVSLFTQETA